MVSVETKAVGYTQKIFTSEATISQNQQLNF